MNTSDSSLRLPTGILKLFSLQTWFLENQYFLGISWTTDFEYMYIVILKVDVSIGL